MPCSNGRVVSNVETDYSLYLTAAWVRIPSGIGKKVVSDLRLGGGFVHHLQLVGHELAQ